MNKFNIPKRGLAIVFCACATLVISNAGHASAAKTGLPGKMIVGYQGWFGCPGDFEKNDNWQHWFLGSVQQDHLTVDLLPSVRGINTEDLCDTGLRRPDGSTVWLFSSQNERVVAAHFRWMQEYNIDGAAAQRFIAGMVIPAKRRRSDNVLKNIQKASETSARVFYVTYDVSGADPETVVNDIRNDWRHLVDDLKITASANYLHENGKPILQLWGFGVGDRPGNVDEVSALIADLKGGRDGLVAATLIGGVPTNWRTLSGDSKSDVAWAKVYRNYDVLSPWSVGRFSDDEGADAFVENYVLSDLAEAKRYGMRYMPVIFPGFSWYNLMANRGKKDYINLNRISRNCGKFFWRQASNLLDAHVETLYAAMFDEVDEATALFPTEPRSEKLPVGAKMVFLNQDGCVLPDNWYLRVTEKIAEYLRQHQSLPKNLDTVIRP
jgi:hypothetical protein